MSAISIPGQRKKQLKKLARLMNKQNVMLVPTVTPVLELLDYDVTNDEIDFLIRLGTKARTIEEIADLFSMNQEECSSKIDDFIKRGFMWGEIGVPGSEKVELAPIVVGWLEMQLLGDQSDEKSQEFANRLENLFAELKKLNFFPVRGISNLLTPVMTKPCQSIGAIPSVPAKGKGSVVQINRNVDHSGSTVFPIQDAYELVDRHGTNNQVAILNCFCRKWRRMMDDPCRFDLPRESCVVVGPGADHICDHGFGRKIKKNDALKILEEMAKGGAIHTLFHEKDNTKMPNVAVCNCCWDCCGIYGSFNRASIPMYFKSHYIARVVAPDSCKVCKKCLKHCPTNAISLIDDKPVIQENICIGCGQCALQCPTNSFVMKPENRDVLVPLVKKSEARIQPSLS